MKSLSRFFTAILASSLLCSCFMLPSAAEQETEQVNAYTQALIDKGFPASYAEALTKLHYLHPAWEFEPLLISEMKEQYTWEYVLAQETDNPKRNLVGKDSKLSAYRHATNTELYDSGWYQASYEAVSYFMDPENFLNEKDIFMFQNLMYADTIGSEVVESALAGTFMADAVLYDDVTYASYLIEVGKALNVDPLHLAARLRQEQGVSGNSPLIKGACGDKLWYYYDNQIQTEDGKQILAPASGHTQDSLTAYNGLYNYFNIGAAGTGYFAIYLGAMKEAQKGTPEMAEQWGGSGAWDTPAKAIWGGAYKLTSKYVGDYQNTVYLQKFNVDPRSSRNFWGQYMQNVGAAVSEARTVFNSLYAMDCLDLPHHFLIPVYEGKPAQNPDPADGTCDTYAPADTMVDRECKLTSPISSEPVLNSVLYPRQLQMVEGEPIKIKATAHASRAFDAFFASVNGAPAVQLDGEHDAAANPSLIGKDAPGRYPNTLSFDCSTLAPGDYTICIYGRLATPDKACPHYLLAVVSMHVVAAPETTEKATTEAVTTQPAQTSTPETSAPTEPEIGMQTTEQAPQKSEQSSCKSASHMLFSTLLLLGAYAFKKKR